LFFFSSGVPVKPLTILSEELESVDPLLDEYWSCSTLEELDLKLEIALDMPLNLTQLEYVKEKYRTEKSKKQNQQKPALDFFTTNTLLPKLEKIQQSSNPWLKESTWFGKDDDEIDELYDQCTDEVYDTNTIEEIKALISSAKKLRKTTQLTEEEELQLKDLSNTEQTRSDFFFNNHHNIRETSASETPLGLDVTVFIDEPESVEEGY
jgi:hypothetical protein